MTTPVTWEPTGDLETRLARMCSVRGYEFLALAIGVDRARVVVRGPGGCVKEVPIVLPDEEVRRLIDRERAWDAARRALSEALP